MYYTSLNLISVKLKHTLNDFLAPTGAQGDGMSCFCCACVIFCTRALKMALKEFIQDSKEAMGVLG